MAFTSTYGSSSSQWSFDVFLSFRGEDTRKNFTDHLYNALIRNNINTFRDDEELPKGGEIAPELLQAIEESRIAVIVFSKNYADSKWCLEELVKIMRCKEEREQKVIPIFYHVDPSEVRNQRGIYEEAFTHHEENADDQKKEKIRRWKAAMREAGDLAGYDVKVDSYESKIIDDIIEEIHGIIPKVLDVNENNVGMGSRLESLISLLNTQSNDVHMIGVYGIGGIGKTTIITALYNKISNQFRSVSFLTNIREESVNDSGLLKLQQQLLDDTAGVRGQLALKNIHEGVKVIKDRFSSKKVLVFLDDVDNSRQLEHLAGKNSWFGDGSRIIITTRKKYLLTAHGVDYMYEVEKLNIEEAVQLFCSYAFKQHLPKKDYGDLPIRVVRYADGLPLALKVLGSLLFGKGVKDWKSELKKLEEIPNMEITNVLKISYDGLDDTQKRIFLDIACFFRGSNVKAVTLILDGFGFHAESGVNALVDRCFITISKEHKIEMHDLLTEMGKGIAYEECPNEPGERSRLWRYKDACQVLTDNRGTEKIEGILLVDEYMPEQIKFTSETLERMTRLRVLMVYKQVQLSEDFAFPPRHRLSLISWDGYSLASLPSNFCASNLVHLNLINGNIKRLWKRNLRFEKLRKMILDGLKELVEIPEFSTMPNLEYLSLSGCVSLESLPGDIDESEHLLLLHCDGCSKLTSFPEIKRNIGKLKKLTLDGTAIKELPLSFELLKDLCFLSLVNCKNLESLPNNFCNLSSLEYLMLSGCSKLGKLPEDLERMPCLEELRLRSVSCRLPSLSGLSHLRLLCLDQCSITPGVLKSDNRLNALEQLSMRYCNIINDGEAFNKIFHLCSLKVLDLSGYNSDGGDILVGISQLSNLKALGLSHCENLSQIPEIPSSLRLLDVHSTIGSSLPPIHYLVNCLISANQDLEEKQSSKNISLHSCSYYGQGICILVQGRSGIPEWIKNEKEGCKINIMLPKVWHQNNEFLGVAICCVYVPLDERADIPETDSARDKSAIELGEDFGKVYPLTTELACALIYRDEYPISPPVFLQDLHFGTFCKRSHYGSASEQLMWVILYPKVAIMDIDCSNQIKSIQAQFSAPLKNWKVIKCGFQPIYAYDPTVETREVSSCIDCRRNVENRKLCLKGQPDPINQLSSIPTTVVVDTLCLRDCNNLESLPSSIWDQFSSLQSLFCSNCSQLRRFPQVLTNMECLRELHLDGTAVQKLPSSIEHLNKLEILNLRDCQELVTLPDSICNLCFLQDLDISFCSKLNRLPQNLGMLKRLKSLFAKALNSRCCQSLSLSGLCSLKVLILSKSKLVMHGLGEIMSEISGLSNLQGLHLDYCKIDERGIPGKFWRLSSLVELSLSGNQFRSIPAWINQLSMLRILNLSHCLGLAQIEDLPSSLRVLDVHGSRLLESSTPLLSSSLFKCFQSLIQDRDSRRVSVIISGSVGIPKCIKPQKKGSEVVAQLPQDWYTESHDLLGFVFYSIYDHHVVIDYQSEAGHEMHEKNFVCELSLLGHEPQLVDDLAYQFPCNACCEVMWIFYYPKVVIEEKYRSNKWKQLKASFYSDTLKVKECGIHLIYANTSSAGKSLIIPSLEREFQQDELKSLTPLLSLGYPGILRSFPQTLQDVENLTELHLDGTAIEELPASIQHLRGLQYLNLEYCYNLVSLPESICNLKSLQILSCSGCSNLREFPEIRENMENLKMLCLDGSAIEGLPSSIENLHGLGLLYLNQCNNLRSLPSTICELKSLAALFCSSCSQLRSFPEILKDMEYLKLLYLDGTALEELPESIEHLKRLRYLDLSRCNNLMRLPESIGYLKSLVTLDCFSCSNFRVLPEISENMENLVLYLDGTAIEELPESIQLLQGLQYLDLSGCSNLVLLPESIGYLESLISLSCSSCSNLRALPEMSENMENLGHLDLSGTSIKELPSSIEHLRGLQNLYLNNCSNLVNIPESICKLSSLKWLYVDSCTELEKFPSNLASFQCLEGLGVSCLPNLRVNCFSSIAADLIQLSRLRLLNLSHCIKLQRVPDLPPTLRTLDVHNCTPLETLSSLSRLLNFSLLKCFKSAIEELECGSYWNNNKAIRVSTPGNNGIPEQVRHREKGSQITVELPLDWHENDDLLGFAIYSVFVPSASGSLSYKLNFCGDCDGSGCWEVDDFLFPCCQICAGSNQMCVSYYPKLAIEKDYWSNKLRHLKASFHGNHGIPVEVKECGFHLIYTEDIPKDTGTDDHRRRQDNDEQISCMHSWLELLSNFIQCISCGRS